MPIIPFSDMEDMMRQYSAMTPMNERGIIPPVDMYQTKDSLVVETPLAGVDPEKVEVTVENGVLTIRGSMEKKIEVEEKDYYRKEVRSGTVFRQVALPTRVLEGKAEASFENGLLKVRIPKASHIEFKPVKIQVKKKK